jgi:hypothetical protein
VRAYGKAFAAFCFIAVSVVTSAGRAVAGPPYLTDDPVPTGYGDLEIYEYAMTTKDAGVSTETQAPALEINWGAAKNIQISATFPYTFLSVPSRPGELVPQGVPGTTVSGYGDTEFAVKYRFLQETSNRPQISFYPAVEIPTGNSQNGIGNGRTSYRLPVWAQKSWGRWTTYGGGGYVLDDAPGTTNFAFGGALLQRDLSDNVSVGGEIYYQGAQFAGDRYSMFYNAGSFITLDKGFGILFSASHTLSGDNQSVAYFALGWTGAIHKTPALLDTLTLPASAVWAR